MNILEICSSISLHPRYGSGEIMETITKLEVLLKGIEKPMCVCVRVRLVILSPLRVLVYR